MHVFAPTFLPLSSRTRPCRYIVWKGGWPVAIATEGSPNRHQVLIAVRVGTGGVMTR